METSLYAAQDDLTEDDISSFLVRLPDGTLAEVVVRGRGSKMQIEQVHNSEQQHASFLVMANLLQVDL